jgi:hypothetical protein
MSVQKDFLVHIFKSFTPYDQDIRSREIYVSDSELKYTTGTTA